MKPGPEIATPSAVCWYIESPFPARRLLTLVASKVLDTLVAVVGIAAASAAAWWYQRPAPANTGERPQPVASSASGAGSQRPASAPGSGRLPSVEVARVEVARLTDDIQAVASLRSRRGVVLRPEVSGRIAQLNFTDG